MQLAGTSTPHPPDQVSGVRTRSGEWGRHKLHTLESEIPLGEPKLPARGRGYWQILAQLDVEIPVAAHDRKHASRGDSLGPQFEHTVVEMPQIDRHDDVLMFVAMHES